MGYYHIKISDISSENIKEIKNNRDIESTFEVKEIGYSNLDGIQNKGKP